MKSEYFYDVYLAGPFFTDEQKRVMDHAKEECFKHGIKVCDPRDLNPVLVDMAPEERKKHTRNIFLSNITAMRDSFMLLACIDDRDTGTAFELGYFYSLGDRPMATFSDKGYGCNVMLSEAADFHWPTVEEMSWGMMMSRGRIHSREPGFKDWLRRFSSNKAEATE